MDSGNNKHHCFTDPIFFPTGVKWGYLNITGAHGTQRVRVGRGIAQFYTERCDNTLASWSCPDSILNPSSPVNLLCMDRFHHRYPSREPTGHEVRFLGNVIELKDGRCTPLPQHPTSNLYLLRLLPRVLESTEITVFFKRTQLRELTSAAAIRRMCYPNEEHFNQTLKHNMLNGTSGLRPVPVGYLKGRDAAWFAGKMTQRSIPRSSGKRRPSRPGSDIYTDIVGPFPVATREGYLYFVLYKDAFTQHSAVYLMKSKDELLDTWKKYLQDMRMFSPPAASTTFTPTANTPGILYYPEDPQFLIHDDDQLYVAGDFNVFNREHLVGQWTIAPYTHSANPAEPAIRRILEAATSVLHRSGFPPSFALYAVQHAVQGHNRCFTPIHYKDTDRLITPHQRRLHTKPHIDDLPPFGALAYVHIPRDNRKKCQNHSWVGFYAGPPRNMNGFRVFRPMVNKIYERYHVIFDADIYYGDFMGEQYKKRVRADVLQREYYNAEVQALLSSPSGPLVDLLNQHP